MEGPLPREIVAGLRRDGLIGAVEEPRAERLTGGVSSDIWKVTAGERVFCVKRAMAKLAVKDEWLAPVERNRFERLWYETANARVPGAAPKILASDDGAMFFAMEFLDPARFGCGRRSFSPAASISNSPRSVGSRLALIHAATADDAAVAAMFPTGAFFEALRLDPYLRATARRHPGSRERTERACRPDRGDEADARPWRRQPEEHHDRCCRASGGGRAATRSVFSTPNAPGMATPPSTSPSASTIFSSSAWRGRPRRPSFSIAFDELRDAYLGGVDWEPRADLEARAASLLPGLFLARVDGKSPVEYVTGETDRERVRRVAVPLIRQAGGYARRDPRRLGGELGLMTATIISAVAGAASGTSRGRPTVEAEVLLAGGAVGRAIAPAGASTGSGEAVDLRDGGTRFGGHDVTGAVASLNGEIARALDGRDVADQAAIDRTPDRARRHAEQVAPRRQRDDRHVARRRPCPGRGARACRSGSRSPATGRSACRFPRSSSSAAAPTPRAASTSRISW